MAMLSQSFIILALVSAVPRVALAQEPAIEKEIHNNDVPIESGVVNERLFIQFFVKRRKEHLDVVQKIRQMEIYEKRYKMVSMLAENSLNIIETSRPFIEDIKFLSGDGEILKNLTIRHALSTILENCALFGDVILQIPDITSRVIKREKNWTSTLHWGLEFANETQHLLDQPTIEMFDLVRQELKIKPRDPTYINPYWTRNKRETTNDRDRKMKKVLKESKKSKAPRMVNIEL